MFTDRLTLRPHQLTDLDALCALDTDADARRFVGGIADRDTTARYLDRHIAEFGNGQSWKFAVDLSASGEMAGWCWLQYKPAIEGYEVGYQIDRCYWNTGIATEAARRVIRFAFDDIALDRVYAIIDPANAASERVVLKLGFVLDREMQYHCPSEKALIYKIERKRKQQSGTDTHDSRYTELTINC